MMYLSAVLPLFSAIISLILGGATFFFSGNNLRKEFLPFCLATFWWQFSWVVLFLYNQEAHAELLCRIGYTGIIFLPVFCYKTVNQYLGVKRFDMPIIYALCLVFLGTLWGSDLFISAASPHWFGYYPKAGPLHPLYLLMVAYFVIQNTLSLIRFHGNEHDPIKRTQLKFFILASVIYSFSGVDYLLNYPELVARLNLKLYPFGVFFITLGVFVFVLSHFITLNLTLEKRVAQKTFQLRNTIKALQEAARAKKEFITNVTHELRTPLTLIRGWTDFILEDKELPGEQAHMLDQMQLQTLSLTNKINELLKVSRYDAGMAVITLNRMDMDAFIFEIVSSFRGITEGRQLQLNYYNRSDLPLLYMDQEKLRDILNNLIRNAYKFTEIGEISVTLTNDDDTFTIEVRDTGVGMSPQVMKTIFQRFKQGDSSQTRRYEGTGLGLAIVKESMDFLKGEIKVKSREQEGTCFRLVLPRNLEELDPNAIIDRRKQDRRKQSRTFPHEERRQSRDRRAPDLAAIDSGDMVKIDLADSKLGHDRQVRRIDAPNAEGTIVIAEDNTGIQELMIKALHRYTLYVAPDGRVAWDTIKKIMPDLVISDIMMPYMGGFELLEEIRSHKPTSSMPVIIVTSLSDRVDQIKCLQLGADEFIVKPFHYRVLQARVKNVLGLHQLEREQTRSAQLETFLTVLASAIESKDTYTGGHVERVAKYARDIALKLQLPENQVHDIHMGTIVHDVGKIGIKDEVLNKKGRLTPEEFEHIKEHPVIGKRLLSQLEIAPVAVNIAYYHQERWDGSGYPTGAKGLSIPLEARIAAIADFWDAITSDRPYRRAMFLEEAVEVIKAQRGVGLDPELLDLFMDEADKIYLRYVPTNTGNGRY